MFCLNCGKEVPDGSKCCVSCGTPVGEAQQSAPSNVSQPAEFERPSVQYAPPAAKRSSSKRNVIILVVVLVLVVVGAVVGLLASGAIGGNDPIRILDTAERYLDAKDYEEAIILFEKVLEIDPLNVDAYLGLAEVYKAQGDIDKAIEILEEALEVLEDEADIKKINDMLARMVPPPETEEVSVVTTTVSTTTAATTTTATTTTATTTTATTTTAATTTTTAATTTTTAATTEATTTTSATTTLPTTEESEPDADYIYWVIFEEGYRNNRVELSIVSAPEDAQIIYSGGLYMTEQNEYCYQFYYDTETGEWAEIGTYRKLTDKANAIIASNADIYDSNGNIVFYDNADTFTGYPDPLSVYPADVQ